MKQKLFIPACAIILVCLIACQNNTAGHNASPASDSTPVKAYEEKNNADTLIQVNGSKLSAIAFSNACGHSSGDSAAELSEFISSNIRYFKYDTLIPDKPATEMYYRSFLNGTDFLKIEKGIFIKGNFTFSLGQYNIKNYGHCYIAKYYFPAAVNAARRRATIILNKKKKELSIWNFDDVNVSRNGIMCDFNVRGNHGIYTMAYSDTCSRFVVTKEN